MPDLLRVSLAGCVVPARVRAGFSRTWSVQVVSDMWQPFPDAAATVRVSMLRVEPAMYQEGGFVTGHQPPITAELMADGRLCIAVHPHLAPSGITFTVQLEANYPGCVVLPLQLGPITVATRLAPPVLPAPWSRLIPLRGLSVPLAIHEGQDFTSDIASMTWDPGVLLAAYLAEAAVLGSLACVGDCSGGGVRRLGTGVRSLGTGVARAAAVLGGSEAGGAGSCRAIEPHAIEPHAIEGGHVGDEGGHEGGHEGAHEGGGATLRRIRRTEAGMKPDVNRPRVCAVYTPCESAGFV